MITISTEVGISMVAGLVSGILFLFKLLQNSHAREIETLQTACNERIREKEETINWLKEELRTSLRTTERATTAAETATTAAQKASGS